MECKGVNPVVSLCCLVEIEDDLSVSLKCNNLAVFFKHVKHERFRQALTTTSLINENDQTSVSCQRQRDNKTLWNSKS